jgi:hypothetical protein
LGRLNLLHALHAAGGLALVLQRAAVEVQALAAYAGHLRFEHKIIEAGERHGALWEMKHGHVQRFRCHSGHAFTAEALNESSRHALEATLWVVLRMREERKILLTSMASRAGKPAKPPSASMTLKTTSIGCASLG